jgi:hypothetical protein
MSHQLALCYRVLKEHNISVPLDFGITIDDFISHEAKALWGIIIGYYTDPRSAGSLPDASLLSQDTTAGTFIIGDDMPNLTIEHLCHEVRRWRVASEGNQAVVKFSEAIAVHRLDPMGPLAELQGHVTRLMALGTRANTDMSLLQGAQNLYRRIQRAGEGVNLAKLSWPWEPLQACTFGIQPDDYVIFYARPKQGKTWNLAYLIAWAFHYEKRVLVYTKEMTPDNIYMRTLACIMRIAYTELRGAAMSQYAPLRPEDQAQLDGLIRAMHNDANLASLVTVLSGRDVGAGQDTVPWLRSKIERYKPEIMFIDGEYLLSDHRKSNSDHQRVMNISRDIRDMVLATRVPVIGTMQANRKAEGNSAASGADIAYSDALAQDTTLFARIIKDKESPTSSVIIGGSREFDLHGFRMYFEPAKNFGFHSILNEKEIQKAIENDVGEDEKKDEKPTKAAKAAKKSGNKPAKDTRDADEAHHFKNMPENLQ